MLYKVGRVVGIAKDGLILVKAMVQGPDRLIGLAVFDYSMRRIGKVSDVIGPVSSPYILVKPQQRIGGESLINIDVYVRRVDYERALRGVRHE